MGRKGDAKGVGFSKLFFGTRGKGWSLEGEEDRRRGGAGREEL